MVEEVFRYSPSAKVAKEEYKNTPVQVKVLQEKYYSIKCTYVLAEICILSLIYINNTEASLCKKHVTDVGSGGIIHFNFFI